MDDETVVPGAAADDQTEHKQCKLLFLVHLTVILKKRNMNVSLSNESEYSSFTFQ